MNKTYKPMKKFEIPEERRFTPSSNTLHNIEPHWHNFFEFELFLDGDGTSSINDTSIPIKRGLLYFVTIPDIHSAKIKKECTLLNVSFDVATIENKNLSLLLNNTESFYTTLTEEEINYFHALHKRLCFEYESSLSLSTYHAASILETLLYFIFEKTNKNIVSLINSSIQPAIKYINLNFTNKISLADVANRIYMTREHFSREFHKYVGQSFSDYLLALRLKHSKNLLATTQLSIANITTEIGLEAPAYFSRIFKQKFGISPSEYRNKCLSSNKVIITNE